MFFDAGLEPKTLKDDIHFGAYLSYLSAGRGRERAPRLAKTPSSAGIWSPLARNQICM